MFAFSTKFLCAATAVTSSQTLLRSYHAAPSSAIPLTPAKTTKVPGKVRVHVTDREGRRHASLYPVGVSLMEAIRNDYSSPADLRGCCDGSCRCATCHVQVSPRWAPRLGRAAPPHDAERDLLDAVPAADDHSRLGCQIVLQPHLDGLEVTLPPVETPDMRFA